MDTLLETALRLRIIDWVQRRAEVNGGFLHRQELLAHRIDGADLPVIDYSRGIRNPRDFASTLSIVVSASGPYDDAESDDGLLHYAYRDGDPWGGDNRKMRNAIETGQPLARAGRQRRRGSSRHSSSIPGCRSWCSRGVRHGLPGVVRSAERSPESGQHPHSGAMVSR